LSGPDHAPALQRPESFSLLREAALVEVDDPDPVFGKLMSG
jgi:hypothetical protein